MKKGLYKRILWASVLSVYSLLIAFVVSQLLELNPGQLPSSMLESSAVAFHGQERVQLPINPVAQANGFSGILLPLGPDDGRLPGLPALWDEFFSAGKTDSERLAVDGFNGLQAVKNVAELSKNSVAELFLSGLPQKVFRQGNVFLVLDTRGNVQIIDCQNPHQPKRAGFLPYQMVKHVEMQGDTAYLLLSRPEAQNDKLVIVDLENPHEPRELTRLSLPKQTMSFFLADRQLVVYARSIGYKGDTHFIYQYDLTADLQLVSRGRVANPLLRNGFFKYKNYLLIPDDHAGLHIYDYSDPLQPTVVSSLVFPDQVRQLTQHGDKVFVLGVQDRIYVIDLHDPAHPVLSTVLEEANYPAYFAEYGRYLYYFTLNGYLQIFDLQPYDPMAGREQGVPGLAGELVALQAGAGFTLLGNIQGPLTIAVKEVLALDDKIKVVDTLVWQKLLVVLDNTGLVYFFRQEKESSLVLQESLKLPPAQRWLAASDKRLYVGDESMVYVVAKSGGGHFTLSGHLQLGGKESWDGLVIQQTLCIVAGKDGLLCFSLEQPDRPALISGWTLPRHLESQVDMRQLITPGDSRVLISAGPAGLLSGKIDDHGEFLLGGLFDFLMPSRAIAVIDGLCLVSTETSIYVVDIRKGNSLQNLGEIYFQGVARFAVAAPDFFAGYVPAKGWFALPVPRLVLPGEFKTSHFESHAMPMRVSQDRYRLNLFNDHGVITVPGILSLSPMSGNRVAGAAHGHD